VSESTGHPRRLSAGRWYAVLGDRVTLLLPGEERARATRTWELVDGGADFDEVLDTLLSQGIRTLAGFVLVGHGDTTRVLVRGGGTVTLTGAGGDTVVAGEDGAVWAERSVPGVTGGTVVLEESGPADLVLAAGITRAGSLSFGDVSVTTGPTGAGVDRHRLADAGQDTVEDAAARPEPAHPDPASAEAGEPRTYGAPADDDPTPTGEQPAVADPVDPVNQVDQVDHVGDRDGDDGRDGHDGLTSVGPPTDSFVRPDVPGQEVAPAVVSRPVARLVLSTGEVVEVDRTIIVGRAPEARRLASADQPHLVTVASPHHEISSTHLEIRPGAGADHGSAVVTDLGSTNGTVLVQPGLPPEDLQAGIAVSLIPGAILDLGDGVTIQTTNA
jgi:FHA domain